MAKRTFPSNEALLQNTKKFNEKVVYSNHQKIKCQMDGVQKV